MLLLKILIDKDIVKLMKKTAVIINIARGEIINEKDLYDCFKFNVIRRCNN